MDLKSSHQVSQNNGKEPEFWFFTISLNCFLLVRFKLQGFFWNDKQNLNVCALLAAAGQTANKSQSVGVKYENSNSNTWNDEAGLPQMSLETR